MPRPNASAAIFRITILLLVLGSVCLGGCGGPGATLSLRSVATGAAYTPSLPTAVYRYEDINTADIYLSDIPMEVLANPDIDLREWAADRGGQAGGRDGIAGDGGATIVHIHLFVLPRAGKTPIDATACNATIRQLVLAPPARDARPWNDRASADAPRRTVAASPVRPVPPPALVGLYGGGGFIHPGRGWFGTGGTPGGETLSGSIKRGSGFGDPTNMEGLSGARGVGGGGGGTLRLIRAERGFVDPIGAAELSGKFTAALDEPLADVMAARLEMLIASIPEVREPEPQLDAGQPSTPATITVP